MPVILSLFTGGIEMTAKNRTCCFTGHRMLPERELPVIASRLEREVEKLINRGVIYFGAGGALGFDTLAARTVARLRGIHPEIKLILVLPCIDQTRGWPREDIEDFGAIKAEADKVVYTSEEYFEGCMQKRNRHLVENSAFCVAYLTRGCGGTYSTVRYARELGLSVINIAL